MHDAKITASYALEVPSGAGGYCGGGTIRSMAPTAMLLVCYSGGITVTGSGSLSTLTDSTGFFDYAVNTQAAKIYPSTLPEILHRTVFRLRAAMLRSRAAAPSRSPAWCAQARQSRLRRGDSLSITNTANMAMQSINSGSVSLTAKNGNITVSGGRNYAGQYNAIQATNGSVTLDASGEIQVAGYNGYPGIGGGS